jgi:Na+-transporting methylmalonyl-CoA/oxaloacetate decarboxylase gamma subunit
MTKHDKVFLALLIISVVFIGAVITQNLSAQAPAPVIEQLATVETSTTPYDPAQAESIRKKFEAMGLRPHEGRFWKE